MKVINMPQVGQDIPTAVVSEWLKKPGDTVEKGDVIATVESDKATFEVESPASGTLLKIIVQQDEEGEVFKPLAYVGDPSELEQESGSGGQQESQTTAETVSVSNQPIEVPESATAPTGGDTYCFAEEDRSAYRLDSSAETSGNGGAKSVVSTQSAGESAPELNRPKSSPAARRVARETGADLNAIPGTGPGGRIIAADVTEAVQSRKTDASVAKAYAERLVADESVSPSSRSMTESTTPAVSSSKASTAPQPATDAATGKAGAAASAPAISVAQGDLEAPFSRMRQIIADRMTASVQTIPHFYLEADVDVTSLQAWRARFKQLSGLRITVTDIVIKACGAALRKHPRINAHVDSSRSILKQAVNIGVATSVEDGLLVPVIPSVPETSLREVSDRLRQNTQAAKSGKVDMSIKGTFTISSLGMYGVSRFLPIINAPECAILAIGAIERRIVPIEGGIGSRDMLTLTLGVDHRAVDGADAAQFLQTIKEYLENPCEGKSEWLG